MSERTAPALPEVITFYSYKGGTGRSMALANVACLLAERGEGDVLIIDWDLEAPGLDRFFADRVVGTSTSDHAPGLLELFQQLDEAAASLGSDADEAARGQVLASIDLSRFLVPLDVASLFLMKAGCLDESYGARVNAFSWEELYARAPWLITGFANMLTRFRYVLIDSRTGLSDTSGICTTLLPNRLVAVFTPNQQSLTGLIDRVRRAAAYRRESGDVRPLTVFPLPSRIELSEDRFRRRWRFGDPIANFTGYQSQFERLFEEIYDLQRCDLTDYFDAVQIQHAPVYAYGEQIAVLREKPADRLSLANSYAEFCDRLVRPAPWLSRHMEVLIHGSDAEESPLAAPAPMRVFLGHTSELREFPRGRSFVAAAEAAVARVGMAVLDMAYFSVRDSQAIDYLTQMVGEADVYVGIIGFRYGVPVRGHPGQSYTELEFEAATSLGLPRLVFLLDERGTIPLPAEALRDPDRGIRQERFRRRLMASDLTVARITTPAELELALYQALVELRSAMSRPTKAT